MMPSVYIVSAIVGGALAQIFMKAGLFAVSTSSFGALSYSINAYPKHAFFIFLGIFLYVASMCVWVYALKQYKLSKAYPLLSLGYVVVYVISTVWPGIQESFSTQKSIGIALIVFGVWFSQRTPDSGAEK